MFPLLQILPDGKEYPVRDLEDALAEKPGLADVDLEEIKLTPGRRKGHPVWELTRDRQRLMI